MWNTYSRKTGRMYPSEEHREADERHEARMASIRNSSTPDLPSLAQFLECCLGGLCWPCYCVYRIFKCFDNDENTNNHGNTPTTHVAMQPLPHQQPQQQIYYLYHAHPMSGTTGTQPVHQVFYSPAYVAPSPQFMGDTSHTGDL